MSGCQHASRLPLGQDTSNALEWFLYRMDCDIRGWFAIDNPRTYVALYGKLPEVLSAATFREVFEDEGNARPHLTISKREDHSRARAVLRDLVAALEATGQQENECQGPVYLSPSKPAEECAPGASCVPCMVIRAIEEAKQCPLY